MDTRGGKVIPPIRFRGLQEPSDNGLDLEVQGERRVRPVKVFPIASRKGLRSQITLGDKIR